MKTAVRPIPFAASLLGEVRHVCTFFSTDDEKYRVLLPFIADGFQSGDKAIHVVNPERRHDHLRRIAMAGFDATAARQSGQVDLRTTTETYLWDRRAADGRSYVDNLVECESRVNHVCAATVKRSFSVTILPSSVESS